MNFDELSLPSDSGMASHKVLFIRGKVNVGNTPNGNDQEYWGLFYADNDKDHEILKDRLERSAKTLEPVNVNRYAERITSGKINPTTGKAEFTEENLAKIRKYLVTGELIKEYHGTVESLVSSIEKNPNFDDLITRYSIN